MLFAKISLKATEFLGIVDKQNHENDKFASFSAKPFRTNFSFKQNELHLRAREIRKNIVRNATVCVGALCSVCDCDGRFEFATEKTQRLRPKFATNSDDGALGFLTSEENVRRIVPVSRENFQLLRWFDRVFAGNTAGGHL